MGVRFPNGAEYLLPIASTVDREKLQALVNDSCAGGMRRPILQHLSDSDTRTRSARRPVSCESGGGGEWDGHGAGADDWDAVCGGVSGFAAYVLAGQETGAVSRGDSRAGGCGWACADCDGEFDCGSADCARVVVNERFTAAGVAAALRPLLGGTVERARMVAGLAETRGRLLGLGDPIGRVCDVVEGLMDGGGTAKF